ncbi:MAG TPA: 2-dehydropantoate 2-reductase [Kofleriaceae bacterium]|nr:2-dehydropantoate 2-reductase [Kofleriaceae bacterium]
MIEPVGIAVVGVGAIGGVCAASLARAGREPICCVRTPFAELVLERGDDVQRFAPRVEILPARVAEVAWVLLATKAQQTEGAAGWLRALVDHETRVAVLQNGVEHVARVAPYVDPARVVPVVVACPATAVSPGRIVQRRAATFTVPDDAGGAAFAALFDGTDVTVERTHDWPTAAWRKLCLNVTGGALAALAGVPLPDARHPRLRELAHMLAHECARVARAAGADVSDAFAADVAEQAVSAPTGGAPSTLTDRLHRRPLEVDARNGTVVRLGARHGIATPANTRAAALMARAHLDPSIDMLPELATLAP